MRQRGPVAFAIRRSPVSRTAPIASARATYDASYGVRLSRSSQHRLRRRSWGARSMGRVARSSMLRSARRGRTCPDRVRPRRADSTSRSISAGAAIVCPRSRARARSPWEPSSTSATSRTPASTTITIGAHGSSGLLERDRPPGAGAGPVQDIVEGGPSRLLDETCQQVLLQRLVGLRGSATQDRMSLLRHILDLHARHGAIVALKAPQCKRLDRDLISKK